MSSFHEDDLRDALRALRGDPAVDRDRVLAALPAPAPTPVLRPAWPWVAAAAAAGVLAGFGASFLRPAPAPVRIVQGPAEPQPRIAGKDGALFVETDAGARELAVGETVAFENFVGTADDGRAFVVLPGDVELRLNKGTRVALLGRRSVELAKGQLFVRVPKESGAVHLATIEGEVLARPGSFQVTATVGRTEVVALEGSATFTNFAGEAVELGPNRRVACDDGATTAVEDVDSAWDQVAWQIDLLAGCPDRRKEAVAWTWGLVDELGEPKSAARAELALRRAGMIGAAVLGMAAYDLPDARADLKKRCWLLLAQIGSTEALSYLLGAITSEDPDIRTAAVEAIERITGISSGRDRAFWRDAPAAERFEIVRQLREKVRVF